MMELRDALVSQRSHTENIERERGTIVRHVFHRHGKPISEFRDAFKTACKSAGCPGRIIDDFRRTAVRNFVRRGTAERVAMKLSGHLTAACSNATTSSAKPTFAKQHDD